MRAALLDFDGTLVDLPVDWTRVRADVASLFRRQGVVDEFVPLNASIARAFDSLKAMGLTAASRGHTKREVNRLLTEAEMAAASSANELPGARHLLERLQNEEWATIVQTSNSVHCVGAVFDRLSFPTPTAIVGRETASRPKPNPMGVRRILAEVGIRPVDSVVIGDGDFDVQLGRSIGARTIGVLNPRVARSSDWQSDKTVESLDGVMDILADTRPLHEAIA